MRHRANAAFGKENVTRAFRIAHGMAVRKHSDEPVAELVLVGGLLLCPPEVLVGAAVLVVAAAAPVERSGVDHIAISIRERAFAGTVDGVFGVAIELAAQ